MARKKSATKKAKEADERLRAEQILKAEEASKNKPVEEESDVESSSSEEEDETGNLITDKVDAGISKVLKAIRENPDKLLDKEVKFFDDEEEAVEGNRSYKEKPIYLKDYHRMNLLSGGDDENNEFGTVDGEKPFAVAQREERNVLLNDIKNAFSDDDGSDQEFLTKKEKRVDSEVPIVLPEPDKNPDEFLQTFLDQKAWIPQKNDKVIDLDKIDNDDEEEFEEAVEQFEKAYNFRYEEDNAAEIVSYARNQATLRRDKTNARKRQREKLTEEKHKKEEEKHEKLKKKERAKLNLAVDRLAKIREAVGDDIDESVIQKVFGDSLLNDDFDDADWDSKMAEIFNEQYYNEDNKKPQFSDMEDFEEQSEEEIAEDLSEEQQEPKADEQAVSKKDKQKQKREAKKEKTSIKEKAKKLVEANKTKIIEEVEDEIRGRSQEDDIKFKYREVSPETFGLTTRDILIADDKQLNTYIGIKKFAPYRPKELRSKDRRKYKKKRPLLEWRKEVFRKYKPKEEGDENTVWLPTDDDSHKKHKRHKKH